MSNILPTNELRFIERTKKVARETYGGGTYDKAFRVLQQKWVSLDGEADEWRDVPLFREDTDATP